MTYVLMLKVHIASLPVGAAAKTKNTAVWKTKKMQMEKNKTFIQSKSYSKFQQLQEMSHQIKVFMLQVIAVLHNRVTVRWPWTNCACMHL